MISRGVTEPILIAIALWLAIAVVLVFVLTDCQMPLRTGMP